MKRIVPILIIVAVVGGLSATFWYLWKKSHVPPVVYSTYPLS